ncbi:MAG: hypothetical protein K5985_05410 [Lachnospiraceae bacterium]|nr:hypothetical protein [Lachnospiraceae bacterium]
MKKAVVIGIKEGRAAVLAPDGAINFIKDRNYRLGQKLDIDTSPVPVKTVKFVKAHSAMVAAAAAVLIVAGSFPAVNSYACSDVTLDINPSFKYTLNPFDRVLEVSVYNDDAGRYMDEMAGAKGKTLEKAIELTLDVLEEDYIENETEAVITVSSRFKREEKLEEKVKKSVEYWNSEKQGEEDDSRINLEVIELTDELSDRAEKENRSPGSIYMEENSPKEPEETTDIPTENGTFAAPELPAGGEAAFEPEKPADDGNTGGAEKFDDGEDSARPEKPSGSEKASGKEKPAEMPDEPSGAEKPSESGTPRQGEENPRGNEQPAAPDLPEGAPGLEAPVQEGATPPQDWSAPVQEGAAPPQEEAAPPSPPAEPETAPPENSEAPSGPSGEGGQEPPRPSGPDQGGPGPQGRN